MAQYIGTIRRRTKLGGYEAYLIEKDTFWASSTHLLEDIALYCLNPTDKGDKVNITNTTQWLFSIQYTTPWFFSILLHGSSVYNSMVVQYSVYYSMVVQYSVYNSMVVQYSVWLFSIQYTTPWLFSILLHGCSVYYSMVVQYTTNYTYRLNQLIQDKRKGSILKQKMNVHID